MNLYGFAEFLGPVGTFCSFFTIQAVLRTQRLDAIFFLSLLSYLSLQKYAQPLCSVSLRLLLWNGLYEIAVSLPFSPKRNYLWFYSGTFGLPDPDDMKESEFSNYRSFPLIITCQ